MASGVLRDGFSFPAEERLKIVVFRPDVRVGSLRVGGLDEPNADWTAEARKNLQTALESAAETRSSDMIFLGDVDGPDAQALNDFRGLFEAVSAEIVVHQFLRDYLPTKLAPAVEGQTGKRYRLDWTLGPGTQQLKKITGADYAMFIFTHDSYGDAGRKVAQLLVAGLFGAYVPAGIHIGYSGLVDLNTGDIVWFNTDVAMGGDVRKPDGAVKRVGQLLSGLPVRDGLPQTPEVGEGVATEPAAAETAAVPVEPANEQSAGAEEADGEQDGSVASDQAQNGPDGATLEPEQAQ